MSSYNNTRSFLQTIVGREKILVIAGDDKDIALLELLYGENAEIDSYVVNSSGTRVPFTLEALVAYDEIVISNMDIRNIRNVNAFI